jgi:hypothetical protein
VDLGFNYYNGDYTKSPRQAQLDKYEHAFDLLGIQEVRKYTLSLEYEYSVLTTYCSDAQSHCNMKTYLK